MPTHKQVDIAKQKKVWDLGNDILYNLCKSNFKHDRDEQILTKVLFIGRIYAAAVERRRNKKERINDNFYIEIIAPTFRKSKLDQYLKKLKHIKKQSVNNIEAILQTHFYLTYILKEITDLNKRSFCSKYLHFHLPELFFIYDSRTVTALKQFTNQVPIDIKHIGQLETVDKKYAMFYCKCFDLKQRIEKHYNTTLTNRQFDNLLLEIAQKKKS
jgi:hypothetical protein